MIANLYAGNDFRGLHFLRWRLLTFLCLAAAVACATPTVPAQAAAEPTVHEPVTALQDHLEGPARHRYLLAELLKQSAEQPLHFLMSAGPIWLSRSLTAVPWYGWSIVPFLAYREWRQWPSQRWWDPPLDAAFLVLGAIMASRRRSGTLALRAMRRRHGRRRRALLAPAPRA